LRVAPAVARPVVHALPRPTFSESTPA
jgi:hypothetical protein